MATALLVIDLQRGMFTQDRPPHDGEAVLARVVGLLGRARERGLPVLHVRHDGGPDDPLERGTEGWEIHPAVAPRGDEPVIDKDRCSAFDRTDLHARLSAQGIDRLIVAGMQTEFCIDTNCRAAHALVEHHTRILHWGGFVEPVSAAEVRLD